MIKKFPPHSSDEMYKRVGIQLGFIATRSGLLRFADHSHLFLTPEEEAMRKRKKEQQSRRNNNRRGSQGEEEQEPQ